MKVTIIVPVYNVEDYLEDCLNSLVNQTLNNIEIIVVNDGSTDNSQQIIENFIGKYPGLIKEITKENGGQASARNVAIEIAQGEYISFVDSDDWVSLDMCETMYKVAKNTDADIVICDTTDHYKDHIVCHKPSKFTNKLRQTPSPCNKIFKRSFIGDLRFPEGKMWYEDFTFVVQLLMKTDKIARCHKEFYHCNCREVSTMSNNNSPKNLDIISALELIINFAEKEGLYNKYKSDLDFMVIDHILITTINRVAKQTHPEKEEVITKLREYVKNQLPELKKLKVFKDMPINRRVIATLNFYGLHNLSKTILNLKSRM